MNTTARQFTHTPSAPFHISPLDEPVDLLGLHATNPGRYPHLLESVAHGPAPARFDILFSCPGDSIERRADGSTWIEGRPLPATSFLEALDTEWCRARTPAIRGAQDVPPFIGGWFVFLAYELVAEIEPKLADLPRSPELPVAKATRFRTALLRDRVSGTCSIVGETGTDSLVRQIQDDVRAYAAAPAVNATRFSTAIDEEPAEHFLHAVNRVKQYIAAGDVFQVNLSRGWRARLDRAIPPSVLYDRLRNANPAPFAGLATFDEDLAIISSSPERLVEVRDGRIATRPIAGTHPRGNNATEDAALARAMMTHPKERAEHVMLIDLERNDLGRLCTPGTVRVNELMGLESYRHVHHIVSEVTGALRSDVRPADVLRAVFPGGTITGCPKIRCMEIIHELEARPRSAYTGSIGYINRDGSMDLNILIRSITQNGANLTLRAGAGIVADSDPRRELAETRAKARGLLDALSDHAP